ncbi:MAG: hypothetical protein ACQEXE_10250 [Bacillota bacterium]
MNITVEIKAPELANAILALASALGNATQVSPVMSEGPQAVQVNQATQAPPVQSEPVHMVTPQQAPPQPVPTAVPVAQNQVPQAPPVAPPQQAVPTATTSYSMDQLAVAATQLVDANRRDDLLQLLASFGVQALTALPKEQYGAFATKLRELGAKI